MLRFQILLLFITAGLTLYSFIDCAQKDESAVRNLPKWGWLLIILFINPIIGPIAWFIAGRPKKSGPRPPKRRILPPDDDPDFLKNI